MYVSVCKEHLTLASVTLFWPPFRFEGGLTDVLTRGLGELQVRLRPCLIPTVLLDRHHVKSHHDFTTNTLSQQWMPLLSLLAAQSHDFIRSQ
jgi:hypothetical protein